MGECSERCRGYSSSLDRLIGRQRYARYLARARAKDVNFDKKRRIRARICHWRGLVGLYTRCVYETQLAHARAKLAEAEAELGVFI